jgi:hypothetical protein
MVFIGHHPVFVLRREGLKFGLNQRSGRSSFKGFS